VWEEDGEEQLMWTPVQVVTVPVDGVVTLDLTLASTVLLAIASILALMPSSPLMEQVTRGCVVELEDTRKEGQTAFGDTTLMVCV